MWEQGRGPACPSSLHPSFLYSLSPSLPSEHWLVADTTLYSCFWLYPEKELGRRDERLERPLLGISKQHCLALWQVNLTLSGVTPELQLTSVSYSLIRWHPQATYSQRYYEAIMRGWNGKVLYLKKHFPVFSHKVPTWSTLCLWPGWPGHDHPTKCIKHLVFVERFPFLSAALLSTYPSRPPFRKSSLTSQLSQITFPLGF